MPTQSSFDIGQEQLFTIFEMAPGEGGIPGSVGMAGTDAGAGVDDYNFTDDFDTGGAEYGVDENVLDLSDAEAEGFGPSTTAGPMSVDDFEFDTSGMGDSPSREDARPDDFELNLADDLADDEAVATEALEPEADNALDTDFSGGFDEDEVEGLGFGFDEPSAKEAPEVDTEEISLDAAPEPEAEISMEPELELSEEEPSLELLDEPELDIDDEQPSLELSEEPSMELPEELSLDADELDAIEIDEEPSIELPDDIDLPEEPELMDSSLDESSEMDDGEAIEFDLDSVDLDEPEVLSYEEEPEAETGGEETFMDLEGLEMETPEEPEDEDLTR